MITDHRILSADQRGTLSRNRFVWLAIVRKIETLYDISNLICDESLIISMASGTVLEDTLLEAEQQIERTMYIRTPTQ